MIIGETRGKINYFFNQERKNKALKTSQSK